MRSPLLCACILLLMGSGAFAQSYTMKINLKAGQTDTVPIDSVRRMTFALATGFAESSTSAYAPAAFRILQNFPNPFNPSTTIVYETAGASEVRVRVFDTRGALIRDLVHEAQSAGMHQVVWDGTGNGQVHVASGVYISVVHSGGQVLSRKMILMK